MHRSMALLASVAILAVVVGLGLARAAVADCATQPCQFLPYLEKSGAPQGAPTPILSTPTRSAIPGASATPTRTATPTQTRTPTATPTQNPNQCAPEYPDFCIPPPPPDLNCADVAPHKNFTVLPPDRHHFDANNNGIGCEG